MSSCFFLVSISFISALIFVIPFFLVILGLVCSLSCYLRYKVRLFILVLSFSLMLVFITINFPAFAASHKFRYAVTPQLGVDGTPLECLAAVQVCVSTCATRFHVGNFSFAWCVIFTEVVSKIAVCRCTFPCFCGKRDLPRETRSVLCHHHGNCCHKKCVFLSLHCVPKHNF